MAISWEDMMMPAGPAAKPSGAVSAEEMLGTSEPPKVQTTGSFMESIGAKQYWDDYVKLSNEYAESLKEDAKANPETLAGQLAQTGKTLLHALGAALSPAESLARTGVIQPVQAAVSRMSELANRHLSAPDIYNAQNRRERWLMGAPVVQQYPSGVDWKIHQTDVTRTAQGINEFVETGVLTGIGFIGAKPSLRAPEPEGLLGMTRVAPEIAASKLVGLKEISTGTLEDLPGLKQSVEKLTDSIKELAVKSPEGAETLARHMEATDPALSAEIRKISGEAQKLTVEGQEALGESLAKPRFRITGETPQGKPILKPVLPDQEVAQTVSEGYETLARPAESEVPKGWEMAGEPEKRYMAQYLLDWRDLNTSMLSRYQMAFESGRPIGAHTLLDTMAGEALGEFQQTLIGKLRAYLDDLPVKFVSALYDSKGQPKPFAAGHYKPVQHEVEVAFVGHGSGMKPEYANPGLTRTILHELVHAATIRWMRFDGEFHPLNTELSALHEIAKSKLPGGRHYGLKNTEEFVAEAFTNPQFQDALSKIRMPLREGGKTLLGQFTSIVRKIFGIKPGDESLLERVVRTSERMMARQKAGRGQRIPELEGEEANVFRAGLSTEDIPGMPVVLGKLKAYYEQIIQTVNPEAFGPKAKEAAAVLAKRIALAMRKDSFFVHRAAERRAFWNRLGPEAQLDFIKKFEKGEKFSDPKLERASLLYKIWNERIFRQDLLTGVEYEPTDNYLYHIFENQPQAEAFFTRKYGRKWGNPEFMKTRTLELYEQALAAGLKPRFTNPEDIMLARQHASDVAQMRTDVLGDMERFGLAMRAEGEKVPPDGFSSTKWRSPSDKLYWVHSEAERVMHNAFNTKSLWNEQGMVGDAFRSAMFLKNTIVPIKLALSLFHPLHVATIDNATGMVRASKELLSGTMGPGKFMKEMVKATLYLDMISSTRQGSRLLRAYQGKLTDTQITSTDEQALRLMAEGGFIPEMSSQYRIGAVEKFRDAVQKRSLTAAWHLPFAAVDLLQRPMFQVWIPSLKISSYLKDVQTAFRTDPSLLDDPLKRQVALRRIAKSIDNRYGEMAYNTLFWNRWVKDLAVANTLSLGWQLGFIREYGGGALDVGQFAKPGGALQKVREGALDRPLFVSFYTTQALAYGGLMTWGLSGEMPQSLTDYIYPKNGEENSDGSAQRVTTMFYPREFAAIYKHIENEGLATGLGHLAASKSSGVIGLTREWATGVNSFGQEIRDPNAPEFKKLEQTLAYTLTDLEPISVGAIRKQVTESPVKTTLMNVAGFGPAPKYVTESPTEGKIKALYQKYQAPKQTAFERAQFSNEARELRRYWDAGDSDKFSDLLEKMQDKYDLTGKEIRRLQIRIQRGTNPMLSMFSRLTWQQQEKLLDQMTQDERDLYLPKANREHLRYNYIPPEER